MSEDQEKLFKLAAEIGAQTGIKEWHKQREISSQERRTKRLRNTKLLVKNYRMFKSHCANAVYEASQITESHTEIIDLMWDPYSSHKSPLKSIKNSVMRTQVIMAHIDEMLAIYKIMCDNSAKDEDKRRYRILTAMYINDNIITVDKISENENIDKRTAYKDIDVACEKISALIFGADFLCEKW